MEKDSFKEDVMCHSVSLCAGRFSDSASGAVDNFHDRKHFFSGVQQRNVLRNEKQLYPDRIGKCSNPGEY
jgi:hypothetical protein